MRLESIKQTVISRTNLTNINDSQILSVKNVNALLFTKSDFSIVAVVAQ